jgi:hypothetical protein
MALGLARFEKKTSPGSETLHAKIKDHANFFFNKIICPPLLPYTIALGTIFVPSTIG